MKRHRMLLACSALALIAVVALAVQGAPVFSGMRWVPPAESQPPLPQNLTGPTASGSPAPRELQHVTRFDISWFVVAAAVIVLVVVAALIWRAVRRRLTLPERDALPLLPDALGDAPPEDEPTPEPVQVRRGLDLAYDRLTEPREPRDAIERAWLGLEEAATDSGMRRLPAETPGEFTTRVVVRVATDRDAATTLLDLYLLARFSAAPVTADEVARARSAVDALRASWTTAPRSATGGPR
ncbi:DUF4129 domain-containing protein [Leifsonia sp. PS1209]|uniref:DUF4129 domain-containing protein n=1 Tax=Leifsonia sp. PS1209 TaxID=2724914 RepID=UPI001FF6FE48|nr:DUF4129 domain-containing protein [Leifsonia sp. PS1209]